jgi:hypothetical protein
MVLRPKATELPRRSILQVPPLQTVVIHQGTQTHITLQFVSCFPMWQKTMMSPVGSSCSLCLRAHYGGERTDQALTSNCLLLQDGLPEARYFSMPSRDAGAEVLRNRALNC